MLKRYRFLLFAVIAVLTVTLGASQLWASWNYMFSKILDSGPRRVQVKEYNEWTLCIRIAGWDVSDAVITDTIPAELEVIGYTASMGTVTVDTGKKPGRSATHITWTIDGPIPDWGYTTLCFQVATRLSPSGKFSRFTDIGHYPLNEGAHVECLRNGVPWSDDTDGIIIGVMP